MPIAKVLMRSFRPLRWMLCGGLALAVLVGPGATGDGVAQAKPKKGTKAKPKPRAKGSKPGEPVQSVRNMLTGNYPNHSTKGPKESAELKAMREMDRQLFPSRKAPKAAPWAKSIQVPSAGPEVSTSGMPGTARKPKMSAGDKKADLSWLTGLKKPDFPVRFDPSVVRYLRYYRDNARGQRLVKAWIKKSGRYVGSIKALLRQYKMPEDLAWVALVESGFNPDIHSHAGAAGLWQFMPATGRIYGLTVNRRVDERLDPERSTHAALKHFKDLYKRFGTWELAFAAYNMGYGGLLSSIRKFNTNDYWKLRRLEAGLPYETALYSPKIMAMAIVANNCKVFGCDKIKPDPPAPFGDNKADAVAVAPGVTIEDVADAIGEKKSVVAALNPHVIGSRLPPLQQSTLARSAWTVYVPRGQGKKAKKELPGKSSARKLGTHQVRWGETVNTLATAFGTSTGWIESLNDLHRRESPRPGTVVFVPVGRTPKPTSDVAKKLSVVVTVPKQRFAFTDKRRVFYEPVYGDTVEDVARVTGVTATEVRRWNHLSERARLQEGMRLQLFLPKDAKPKNVVLFEDSDVKVVREGSQSFHGHHLSRRGKKRIEVTVLKGDTWKKIAARHGATLRSLERINRRSRRSKLKAGEKVVVYIKAP